MFESLILIIIIFGYLALYRVIEKKQKSDKILYILFVVFLSIFFLFLLSIFELKKTGVIFSILFIILIYLVYSDFLIFKIIYEYYLKFKKIKPKTSGIKKPMSNLIKRDIANIKTSIFSLSNYINYKIDIYIFITSILIILFLILFKLNII